MRQTSEGSSLFRCDLTGASATVQKIELLPPGWWSIEWAALVGERGTGPDDKTRVRSVPCCVLHSSHELGLAYLVLSSLGMKKAANVIYLARTADGGHGILPESLNAALDAYEGSHKD